MSRDTTSLLPVVRSNPPFVVPGFPTHELRAQVVSLADLLVMNRFRSQWGGRDSRWDDGGVTTGWLPDAYLSSVPMEAAERLRASNAEGLAALRRYLDGGEAVAFLGAGASAPLYPLWTELVGDLISSAER